MIKVKNLTSKGEIYIYGRIIDDTDASWLKMMEDGTLGYVWPTDIREQVESLKGLPIDVHIASDGGDVAAGIAIYNMLAKHEAPVTVYIDSWAASIASVIAFAGNKIVMPENTFLMIHNPQGGAFGTSDYIRSVADWLDKITGMIADTYADGQEKLSKEEIRGLMDKETWFTAKEAGDIWNKIEVVASNNVEAVACYKSDFKTAPTALQKTSASIDNIIKILNKAYEV